MATPAQWVEGARPRTLPAAIAPVLVGTGVAANSDSVVWHRALLALGISLALQIGVNYANDYSDGIRGADDDRVGPLRLTGSAAARPCTVRAAAFVSFAVAAVLGLVLAAQTSWLLIAVGATAIVAAWFYTGGPRPYGYSGLGEVMVLVFFGLVALCGTAYVQTGSVRLLAVALGAAVGCLACSILVVNNLRDIPTDSAAGKRTLAVRIGDSATRMLYLSLLAVSFTVPVLIGATLLHAHWTALASLTAVFAVRPVRTILRGAVGRSLVPVLGDTGKLQLVYAVVLTVGLAAR